VLDLSQDTNDLLRYRTHIFPVEQPSAVYAPVSTETIQISSLQVLKNASPKLRKAFISNCSKDLLNNISECVLNVLNGNIKLSHCSRRKLKKPKSSLRALVNKGLPLSAKKRVINQHGGLLLHLLTAVLPTLASLIFSKLKSSNGTT
jgi:hypothetical protein